MCIWGYSGKILGIHDILKGYRSQPKESTSYNRFSPSEDGQGGVEPERQNSGIE